MPVDDALRHAAKAVSGKDWNKILVLRDDIKMDSHVGWHAILKGVRSAARLNTFELVLFSVIALFILFSLTGILFLRRPEVWPITLLIMVVADCGLVSRLLLGRPYIITMSTILALGLTWPRLRSEKNDFKVLFLLTLMIAFSTWAHCGWYLFGLPILCFFLAREWRAGFRVTIATILGVAIGAVATGAPYLFLKQTLQHVSLAFGNHTLVRMLVTEFQPGLGSFSIIVVISLILIWRALRGSWNSKVVDNPFFILAVISWALGFVTLRVLLDIGLPAIAVFIAKELEDFFEKRVGELSWKRVVLAILSCGILYLAITNDVGSHWSGYHPYGYISMDDKRYESWLPGKDGVIYSDDMGVFYTTFYKNPSAPWRYVLGFEPAIMPKDDLDIYRNIQLHHGDANYFDPWVKKMRLQDRLIVLSPPEKRPAIKGLEWYNIPDIIWIGRIPKSEDSR
jgi:hypothetical protein